MNKVILMGRLVRDPEIRITQGQSQMAIARYTLAVDRRYRKEGDTQTADFINCVAFGKRAEFVEKYLVRGMRIAVTGNIQTGSYINKDNVKVYTTVIVVEDHYFAEGRKETGSSTNSGAVQPPEPNQPSYSESANMNNGYYNSSGTQMRMSPGGDGFMNIPDGVEFDLPFD